MAFQLHGRALIRILALLGLVVLLSMTASASAEKPGKLHFFMLIIPQNLSNLDNHNPLAQYTAVRSAAPVITQNFTFGVLNTFDSPISKKPSIADPKNIIGRIQGWYGDCGQDYLALCLSQTFTYDDSVFSGTFSLIGVDKATAPYKEAPIVGGTGDFAFCRGIAGQQRISDISINDEENAWFEYNVTLKC